LYTKALVLAVLVASSVAGQAQKVSPDLAGRNANAAVNVIVQFSSLPTQRHKQTVIKAGGQIKSSLPIVKGLSVTIAAGKLGKLATNRDVVYISLDRPVRGSLNNTAGAVNAAYAWNL